MENDKPKRVRKPRPEITPSQNLPVVIESEITPAENGTETLDLMPIIEPLAPLIEKGINELVKARISEIESKERLTKSGLSIKKRYSSITNILKDKDLSIRKKLKSEKMGKTKGNFGQKL